MTKEFVADEQLGQLLKKFCELARRIKEGTLGFKDVITALQRIIEGKFFNQDHEQFSVIVDYGLSLEKMIEAGNYGNISFDAKINPPVVSGEGKINITLIIVNFFRSNMDSEKVLQELRNRGLRPAILPELLAFGAQYQEIWHGYSVVALGSIWSFLENLHCVPCIRGGDYIRTLEMRSRDRTSWPTDCHFLAVRDKVV